MKFSAKLSTKVKWISGAVSVFLLGDAVFLCGIFINQGIGAYSLPIAAAFSVLLFVFVFGEQVVSYQLTEEELVIERRWRRKCWPVQDILEICADEDPLRGALRSCGTGGLFGYYYRFRHRDGMALSVYVTDEKNCVMLKTKGGLIVVSPHERELFKQRLAELCA